MGTRIGCVDEKECDVGLGLKMSNKATNSSKSLGAKKTMMTMMRDVTSSNTSTTTTNHNNNHHHHHLGGGGGGDDEQQQQQQQHCSGGGPMFSNTSNTNTNTNSTSLSDIYDVGSLLFPNSETSFPYHNNNSSGVMVSGGCVRHNNNNYSLQFTASQRQELENQTMICKYMMASIPVPPQLLIPITTPSFSNRSLELRISSNSSDSEPWRCRRTDGKKWRCSRNVVPDQKYCERHSHKSRPRSRKHVEPNSSQFNSNSTNTNMPYSKPSHNFLEHREERPHPSAFSVTSHHQPRSLEWFMKGHEMAGSNQDWHQIVEQANKPQQQGLTFTTDFTDQVLQQQQQQPQSFFLNPNLSTTANQTRHFIDAWSSAGERELESDGKSSMTFSSLSLSMHGGTSNSTNSGGCCDQESEESGQMGFGIGGGDFLRSQWNDNNNNNNNNSITWDNGSPPGGPLAEALCLGIAGSSTRESSSRSS